MTFHQDQSGGPEKTGISAEGRAKGDTPDLSWPEAARLILSEIRKARDAAKTRQVNPRHFPKRLIFESLTEWNPHHTVVVSHKNEGLNLKGNALKPN
jgi:hypothetical protein